MYTKLLEKVGIKSKSMYITWLLLGLLCFLCWTFLGHLFQKDTMFQVQKLLVWKIAISTVFVLGALISTICILYKSNNNQEKWLKKTVNLREYKPNTDLTDQLDYQILFDILKIKGLNQKASPNNIAKEIGSTPEIVLAHLNEMHDKLLVTFLTKESPPSLDTDFFLSEKAYMYIDIKKSNKEYLKHIKESNEAMPDRIFNPNDDFT